MANDPDLKKAQESLDQAADHLRLSGRLASDGDLMRVNRTLGKDDVAFADAAAGAVSGCKDAYAGVSVTAASIESKSGRLRGLRDFKGAVDQLGQQLAQEINVLRVDIAADVDTVKQAARAVLLHPGTDPSLKKRAGRAAQHLFSLEEGRKDDMRSSLAATRALTSKVTTTEEEKEALKDEVEKLRLENKFLAGEDLRPADLKAPASPPAPAARGRRRGKR